MVAAGLAGRRVVVEVPATIANLGAGYDCLGLAIDLSLRVTVEAVPGAGSPAIELDVAGEGVGEIPAGRGNRFVEALERGLRDRGVEHVDGQAWRIAMTNEIPLARGLGSSGAATVGGLLAAAAFAGEAEVDPARLLAVATELEGHPDNVAPALYGGFVASLATDSGVRVARFDVSADLRVMLLVPELPLSTAAMRAVLPDSVPRADAVSNLARVAIGVAGIATGDWSVLAALTEDRLHEPYRAAAFPPLPALVAAARAAGALGACLAGAGSTVAAFTLGSAADAAAIGDAMLAAAAANDLPAAVRQVRASNGGGRLLER